MKLRFYVDPATGKPHIRGHGVTEGEAEHVVYDNGMDQAIGGGNIVVHTKK